MMDSQPGPVHESLLCAKNWLVALALSLVYHVVLLLLLMFSPLKVNTSLEFWLFFASDMLLMIVLLMPLVGAWRRQIAWHDPLTWLFILMLGMFSTIVPAYLLEPGYVSYSVSYGSHIFLNATETDILAKLTEAHLVVLVFALIVLITNRRFLPLATLSTRIPASRREYRIALVTAMLAVFGGIIGFLAAWSEYSFIDSLLSMGSIQAAALEEGSGRYFILQNIAVTAVPLGLIGWLGLRRLSVKKMSIPILLVVLGIIFVSGVPGVVFGSRLSALFVIVGALMQLAFFGLALNKRYIILIGILTLSVVAMMTLVRGNLTPASASVNTSLSLADLTETYLVNKGSIAGPLLDLNRTGAIALILEMNRFDGAYTYGESLIAGPANLIASILAKMTGESWNQNTAFKQANIQISLWRFGQITDSWAVPPSYPGEFYMQFGPISLVLLSGLFGYFFRWLRVRIWNSHSVIQLWVFVVVAITVVKFIPNEVSVVFSALFFTVLPVVIIYYLVALVDSNSYDLGKMNDRNSASQLMSDK